MRLQLFLALPDVFDCGVDHQQGVTHGQDRHDENEQQHEENSLAEFRLLLIHLFLAEHDLAEERPAEYARQAAAGSVPYATAPSHRSWLVGRVVGTAAVVIGLSLVALILYAVSTQL